MAREVVCIASVTVCIYSLGESNFKDKILTQVGLTAADIPDREV